MTILPLFIAYASVLSAALARAGHRSQAASSSGAPRHDCSRVLIVGATGGTGRQLVTQALERGYTVTALVRDPSKLQIGHPQLKVIQGNVLDESSVGIAMCGQDAGLSRHGRRVGKFLLTVRISRADVADFMLNQLASDTYLRTAPGVCW